MCHRDTEAQSKQFNFLFLPLRLRVSVADPIRARIRTRPMPLAARARHPPAAQQSLHIDDQIKPATPERARELPDGEDRSQPESFSRHFRAVKPDRHDLTQPPAKVGIPASALPPAICEMAPRLGGAPGNSVPAFPAAQSRHRDLSQLLAAISVRSARPRTQSDLRWMSHRIARRGEAHAPLLEVRP